MRDCFECKVAPPITYATKSQMSERRAAKREGDEQRYAELNRSVRSAVLRDSRLDISRRIREAGRGQMYRCIRPIVAAKKTSLVYLIWILTH